MKLNKLVSKSIIAIALLGTTLGGAFSGINVKAENTNTNDNNAQSTHTQGSISSPNTSSGMVNDSNSKVGNPQTTSQVKNGFLTLDSVPELNFGSNSSGDYNIEGQPATLKLNDNNGGTLRVTDYRNLDKTNSKNDRGYSQDQQNQSGWEVDASITPFNNNYNYNNIDTTDWSINLNSNGNYHNIDKDKGNTDASSASFNTQKLETNESNKPILQSDKGNNGRGYGVNEVNYNDSSDASLNIPNVPEGTYTAQINWTLSTPLTSYNTSTN